MTKIHEYRNDKKKEKKNGGTCQDKREIVTRVLDLCQLTDAPPDEIRDLLIIIVFTRRADSKVLREKKSLWNVVISPIFIVKEKTHLVQDSDSY